MAQAQTFDRPELPAHSAATWRVHTLMRASFLIGTFAPSCTLLLNNDATQCEADKDCLRFPSAACDRPTGLCIVRRPTSLPDAADGDHTVPGASASSDANANSDANSDAGRIPGGTGDGGLDRNSPVVECPDLDGNGVLDCKESLLINPAFRADIAGWTEELETKQAFLSGDATNNPKSGSLAVTNARQSDTAAGLTMAGSTQCVPTMGVAGLDYLLQTLVSARPGDSVSSGIEFHFYPSTDCSGPLTGVFSPALVDATSTDWQLLQGIVAPAPGTRSLNLRLVVVKPFKQQLAQAAFDNILLRAR
jgi:hypothetical protein